VPAPWEKVVVRESGGTVWRKPASPAGESADGRPAGSKPEIRFARAEGAYGVFAVGSGEYKFVSGHE
jgi:hypothetical protein